MYSNQLLGNRWSKKSPAHLHRNEKVPFVDLSLILLLNRLHNSELKLILKLADNYPLHQMRFPHDRRTKKVKRKVLSMNRIRLLNLDSFHISERERGRECLLMNLLHALIQCLSVQFRNYGQFNWVETSLS